MKTILEQLVEFSNKYGSNPELVLAGGGNTSAKENGIMYVKGSGTRLATITGEQFVKMELDKLNSIFKKEYPDNDAEREALVLADLMSAKAPGEEAKRPSVETMLHGIFEQTFVLHLHPALVNGLTCAVDGKKIAADLFGDDMIWIDACKPGYILSKICFDAMTAYKERTGKAADMLLLQNHGIFIADNTVEGLGAKLNAVLSKLEAKLVRKPDVSPVQADETFAAAAAGICGECRAIATADALSFCGCPHCAADILSPFTPDHIVYCKAYPMWLAADKDLKEAVGEYEEKYGFKPRIIVAQGRGIFAAGADAKQADTAKLLFEDALKIAVYTASFGGALHMTEELTDFIVNWEVESYRSSQNK